MGCCYSRKTRKIKRVDVNETQQKKSSNQNTGNGYGLQDASYIEENFIEVGMRWKSSSKFVKVAEKEADDTTYEGKFSPVDPNSKVQSGPHTYPARVK